MAETPSPADVFDEAIQLEATERASFIESRCAGNRSLIAEVESLLRHADASEEFLETNPHLSGLDVGTALVPGATIGKYAIEGVLGQGGMGVVYRAEQSHPRRAVALKVIRPGFATPALLRRFELEAEVLGRLQHPGIAQIFEAGTAEIGDGERQPFFAMELVEGLALTDFTSTGDLTVNQRLELFIRICDAVHHAHQRGLIHRDLKPANILVDEHGRPKILDFGVARATDSDVATIATSAGELVGTLQYMSPEQVAADPNELDARSDVFSLGVILFEVLSGCLPFDLRGRPVADAVRVIQNEDPSRLSSVDRSLRGDLETIVGKALEREPAQRYQSASELAADIRRYLRMEPIVARPPTHTYQFRKFVRRNKLLVGSMCAIFAALVAGTALAVWQAWHATQASARAELEAMTSNEISRFLQEMIKTANPSNTRGHDVTVREALDSAAARLDAEHLDNPRVRAALHRTVGITYHSLGALESAEDHVRQAHEIRTETFGPDDEWTLQSGADLVLILDTTGHLAEAYELASEGYERCSRVLDEDHHTTMRFRVALGILAEKLGHLDVAERLYREDYEASVRVYGKEDEQTLAAYNNLGLFLMDAGEIEDARLVLAGIHEIRHRVLGADHPSSIVSTLNLAVVDLRREEWHDEAEQLLDEGYQLALRVFEEGHSTPIFFRRLRATLYKMRDQNDLALDEFKACHAQYVETFGPVHDQSLEALQAMVQHLVDLGRLEETLPMIESLVEGKTELYGPEHPETANARELAARIQAGLSD